MSHCRQSPELAIELKSPGSVSLQQILPTIALEVRQRAWTPKLTARKADLYMAQLQHNINAGYPRLKPKLVTPYNITTVPHGLAYSAHGSLQQVLSFDVDMPHPY